MSKVARGPRSSTAGAPQDGCIAPVRGLALPLAGVRYSARPSGACRSRGSGPQDKDIGRSMRRPASAMVVPGLCIQASTGPRRYRPDGRLPSLGRALRRMPDRTAVYTLAGFDAHRATKRQRGCNRQAATDGPELPFSPCRSWMLKSGGLLASLKVWHGDRLKGFLRYADSSFDPHRTGFFRFRDRTRHIFRRRIHRAPVGRCRLSAAMSLFLTAFSLADGLRRCRKWRTT
jgi:hypothetical protein